MSASTKAPSPTKGEGNYGLSNAELKIAAISFKHLKNVPEIDFEAFAAEYGYKDATMARSKYRLAMLKHTKPASGDDNGDGANSTAAAKPKGTPRKRKVADDEDDGEAKPTTKRGRKSANKDTDGEAKATPAKRVRKPKSAPTVKDEDKSSAKEDSPAAVEETKTEEVKEEDDEEVGKEAAEEAAEKRVDDVGELIDEED